MVSVKFTSALQRFFPDLKEFESESSSIEEILTDIDSKWPGIKDYLVDEHGQLRKHVNIFVDGVLLEDNQKFTRKIGSNSEVYFFQALSGG